MHRAEQRTTEESSHWRAGARPLHWQANFHKIFTRAHLTYLSYQIRSVNCPRFLLQAKTKDKHWQGMTKSTVELKSPFRSTNLLLTDVDESCPWWVTELKGGSTLPHCF